MAISSGGWLDWAIHKPGPAWKQNGGTNGLRGFVAHSAEGSWTGLWQVLWSEDRRASWHFSNLKDGRFIQHYSLYAQTWTSGSWYPNSNFPSIESEGVAGEPLTEAQVWNVIRFLQEYFEWRGLTAVRPVSDTDTTATVYEHQECVRWGSAWTSCPSHRYPWAIIIPAVNKEEIDLTFEELLKQKVPIYPLKAEEQPTLLEVLNKGFWAEVRAAQMVNGHKHAVKITGEVA